MSDALPEDVKGAVTEAFGEAPATEVTALTGGRSGATVFAFVVQGKRFVARRRGDGDPARAAQELACLRIAAAQGIAPAIRHVDDARGVLIQDRIDGVMFGRGPSREASVDRVGATLRRLHDGPLFPAIPSLGATFRRLDGALRSKGGAGVEPVLIATVDAFAPVAARGARTVACHNDLNPSNLLEQGDRIFLVDWEAAGAGDPFFDLATLGVFACNTPAARARVFEAYLGRAPNDEERARSTLARVLALAYYAGAFTFVAAMHGEQVDLTAGKPMVEVLAAMATTKPSVVAASLAAEMEREAASAAVDDARRALA